MNRLSRSLDDDGFFDLFHHQGGLCFTSVIHPAKIQTRFSCRRHTEVGGPFAIMAACASVTLRKSPGSTQGTAWRTGAIAGPFVRSSHAEIEVDGDARGLVIQVFKDHPAEL